LAYIGQQPAPKVVTSSDLADDVVTADKIGDTAISGFSALGATPADTDELLVSDAGVLKRIDYSYIKSLGGAISTHMDTINGSNGLTTTSFSSIGSGLSVTFTPASTSSKILLLSTLTTYGDYIFASIFRGSTNLATDDTSAADKFIYQGHTAWQNSHISYLDTPNTTSSITYEVKVRGNGTNQIYVGDGNSMLNTLIAIEL